MKKAYSLIEIMVVVGIFSSVFAFGFLNYRNYARRQQLKSYTRQIKDVLEQVKQKAKAGEKPALCSPLNSYLIKFSDYGYSISALCGVTYVPIETNLNLLPNGFDINITTPQELAMKPLVSGFLIYDKLSEKENKYSKIEDVITITVKDTSTNHTQTITVSGTGEISSSI